MLGETPTHRVQSRGHEFSASLPAEVPCCFLLGQKPLVTQGPIFYLALGQIL